MPIFLLRVAGQVGRQPVVLEVVGDEHRLAAGGQHVGPGQKIAQVDVAVRSARRSACRLCIVISISDTTGSLCDSGLARELFVRRAKHVDVDVRHRAEAAALDQDRLLVEHFGGLQHFARGRKHRRAAQAQLHQPQAHHAVVDVAERDARELDHVDFDAPRGEVVEQRLDELVGLVIEEERAVEQVHADDAQRFLLQGVFGVEHPHVEDDLAVLVARMGLEPHAHPAVALVGALEVARRNGVGEHEERGRVAAALAQPAEVQCVLVVEHRFQPLPADVAVALAVDGVADRHVVGRHALGDRAGGAADAEEPAHHFLPGADLGERAVAAQVEIDGQRFALGVRTLVRHNGGIAVGRVKIETSVRHRFLKREKMSEPCGRR